MKFLSTLLSDGKKVSPKAEDRTFVTFPKSSDDNVHEYHNPWLGISNG